MPRYACCLRPRGALGNRLMILLPLVADGNISLVMTIWRWSAWVCYLLCVQYNQLCGYLYLTLVVVYWAKPIVDVRPATLGGHDNTAKILYNSLGYRW